MDMNVEKTLAVAYTRKIMFPATSVMVKADGIIA